MEFKLQEHKKQKNVKKFQQLITNSGGIFAVFEDNTKLVPMDQMELAKETRSMEDSPEKAELMLGLDALRQAKLF